MSKFYIINNVDLCNTYDDTILFNSVDEQNDFFDNLIDRNFIDINYTFIELNKSVDVEIPYNNLIDKNYCYYQNSDGKRFYNFITDIQYLSKAVTRIFVEVDIMQTFMFDFELMECYIDREHQDRFFMNGTYLISKTNEDLAIGDTYIKNRVNKVNLYDNSNQYNITENGIFPVIITTSEKIEGDTYYTSNIYSYFALCKYNNYDEFEINISIKDDTIIKYPTLSELKKLAQTDKYLKIEILPYTDLIILYEKDINNYEFLKLYQGSISGLFMPTGNDNIANNKYLYRILKDDDSILYRKHATVPIKINDYFGLNITPPTSINELKDINKEIKLLGMPYSYINFNPRTR